MAQRQEVICYEQGVGNLIVWVSSGVIRQVKFSWVCVRSIEVEMLEKAP